MVGPRELPLILTVSSSDLQCQGIRADLADCVMQSDCVQKDGRSGQDCLQHHTDELPDECKNIYKSYVHCKRGMVSDP